MSPDVFSLDLLFSNLSVDLVLTTLAASDFELPFSPSSGTSVVFESRPPSLRSSDFLRSLLFVFSPFSWGSSGGAVLDADEIFLNDLPSHEDLRSLSCENSWSLVSFEARR